MVLCALAVADEVLSRRTGCLLLLEGKEWGMIPIGALEGGKSGREGAKIVMSIFYPKDLLRSRVVGCQRVEGSFQVLVLFPLSAQRLGMKTRKQADLGSQQTKELLPKHGYELRTAIRHYGSRQTKEPKHIL